MAQEVRIEVAKREMLARSRNYLLTNVLRDEEWVLWMDMDVWRYPETLIQDLLAHKQDILVPNCLYVGEMPTLMRHVCMLRGALESVPGLA